MQIPEPGDLISIDKVVDGVVIHDKENEGRYKTFGWTLVKVEPNQNGLVLESYNPKALSNREVAKASDEALQAQQERMARKVSPNKRPPYNKVPEEIRVLVVAIGTNIIEMVFDPEYMSILSL
jgi:hypothetical protein